MYYPSQIKRPIIRTSIQDEDDWAVSDEPQEEDSDSNAVVAESALDRIACGLGGKTVFPQIMNLTPGMLQVATMSTVNAISFDIALKMWIFKNMLMILSQKVDISLNIEEKHPVAVESE